MDKGKIIKQRVCVCDDCAGDVLANKGQWEDAIRYGRAALENLRGFLYGPVGDRIESSDEICEVCGLTDKSCRHIFQLCEAITTDEAVKIIMAKEKEDKKLANRVHRAGKQVSRHSKNVGKEFNSNIYFFGAVMIIIFLLSILAK